MRTLTFLCHHVRAAFLRAMLVLYMLILTGCVDYEEEMWLNHDLSGRMNITVALSDKLSDPRLAQQSGLDEESIRREVQKVEGLRLQDFQSFKENGKQVVRMNVTFTSIEKLGWLGRDSKSPASFVGQIKVSHADGHIIMERSLSAMVDRKPKSDAETILTSGLSALLLGGNSLSYTLHLPVEPLNANSLQVDKLSHTVRWRYPLSQALHEPVTMRVEWKSSGWLWWAVGGVLVLALAAAGASRLRR